MGGKLTCHQNTRHCYTWWHWLSIHLATGWLHRSWLRDWLLHNQSAHRRAKMCLVSTELAIFWSIYGWLRTLNSSWPCMHYLTFKQVSWSSNIKICMFVSMERREGELCRHWQQGPLLVRSAMGYWVRATNSVKKKWSYVYRYQNSSHNPFCENKKPIIAGLQSLLLLSLFGTF